MKIFNLRARCKCSGSLFFLLILPLGAFAQPAAAQDAPSQQDIAIHYSLYYEDFKNGNYVSALPNLRWILENAPGFSRNNDKNFERAVEVYEKLSEATDDPALTRTYLDSSLIMFDKAVSTIKGIGGTIDEVEWIFEKGRFIQKHTDELQDLQPEVGNLYRKTFEMDHARLQPYYIEYIIRDHVSRDDKAGAVEFMEQVESKMGANAEIVSLLATWRGSLFTSPGERISFLESQLEKKPENMEIITELFELYNAESMREKMYAMGARLQEMEPNARTYRILGKMRLDDGDTDEAISLYEKSLQLPGGMDSAREIHYNIGIAHQQEGRLARARTSFREALKVNASFGPALIAIGDLYTSAVAGCGSFEREDRAVYWLAADYYERAGSVDQSVANIARQKARNIRRYYPDQEALFFKGWNVGDRFMVDGSAGSCYSWIGEATKVRSP